MIHWLYALKAEVKKGYLTPNKDLTTTEPADRGPRLGGDLSIGLNPTGVEFSVNFNW